MLDNLGLQNMSTFLVIGDVDLGVSLRKKQQILLQIMTE